MTNKGHKPIRTCVICKKKDSKYTMKRFVIKNGIIYYDDRNVHAGRGYYCCDNEKCKINLISWMKHRKKK